MKNMKFVNKPQAGYKIKKTSTHYIHSKKAKNDCRHLIRKRNAEKSFEYQWKAKQNKTNLE